MAKSLDRIIRRVLEEARGKGRDHLTQTEEAVRAVRKARPDLTASDALAAEKEIQRKVPRESYRAARLLRLVATSGWSGPRGRGLWSEVSLKSESEGTVFAMPVIVSCYC